MEGFAACFEGLDDPRTGNAGRHDLLEIVMMALCTVLCGGENAVDMAEFARAKEEFLRGFLKLKHGVPSHDTFSRVFRLLDPEQFGACFQRFMAQFGASCGGVIAIDGKVLRRSFDAASATSALHMVSAWGCDQRLVLAQIATDAKSNEITAVPKLLKMLSLNGAIVTVDALNCQRDFARQIVDQGGNYVFALKSLPRRRPGATRARCMPMSALSSTTRSARAHPAMPLLTATMAASKPAPALSRPISAGCKKIITRRSSMARLGRHRQAHPLARNRQQDHH